MVSVHFFLHTGCTFSSCACLCTFGCTVGAPLALLCLFACLLAAHLPVAYGFVHAKQRL